MLGIFINIPYFFYFFSFILVLTIISSSQLNLCLEWYYKDVTILLHNLVKEYPTKRATEHRTTEHLCGVSIHLPHLDALC
jgi:hypothetical protein